MDLSLDILTVPLFKRSYDKIMVLLLNERKKAFSLTQVLCKATRS